jgi:oligopeptide/dipeptide ABC transporter ATP-binding protein
MTTTALSGIAGTSDETIPADEAPLLVVEDLVQQFKVDRRGKWKKGIVSAVAGVSFEVRRGETLSVVGETGSGKSTLARALIRAPGPKSGRISLNGRELTGPQAASRREAGQLAQMIFQDPFSALNPKWTVEKIITEPLVTGGVPNNVDRRRTVAVILDRVGLSASQFAGRYPYELSGGQAQRVAIGRALVAAPDLVICDEPVTALDVSIQAQILKLLSDLKSELSLTYLLIAHDLAVVRVLSDRTVTMYLGKLCEVGTTKSIFESPAHPYTQALLSAIPPRPGQSGEQKRIRLQGEPPSPLSPPSGCRFHTRCAFAQDICTTQEPQMRLIGDDHSVACHFPLI